MTHLPALPSPQRSEEIPDFRQLYEASPALLQASDAQGRLLAVSTGWLGRLGYLRQHVLMRPWTDFLVPSDRHRARTEQRRAERAGDAEYGFECRILTSTGATVEVLLTARLEYNAQGQLQAVVAAIQEIDRQQNAERALRDERQRLAYIIEGTRAGTWEWNIQSGETRFNEQWAQLVGCALKDLEPVTMQAWYERAHPHDMERSEEVLSRHYAGDLSAYECQVRLRHSKGHWIWVLSRGRVQTWTADGRPEWMYGVDIDISELKAQEEALRKSQSLLNRTGEVAGIGGWELDVLTNELIWSDETCHIHGVPPGHRPTLEEAVHFYAPQARPVIAAAVETGMREGKCWDLELPLIRADGTPIWVRAVGTVEFENGTARRLVGAFQNITEARRLRAELSEQHEMLRITLQSIADAVITTNEQGEVVWLNPVAERMTGWSTEAARTRPLKEVFQVVSERDRHPIPDPLNAGTIKGRSKTAADHRILISREGVEFGIEETVSAIRNDQGQPLGFVLVFHDVTEQRRLSGEMTYRATHDALTGLVNRSEFESRLRQLLVKSSQDQSEHALLYIDLDQFKLVNDSCGHSVGDEMLQQAAKLFREAVRVRDTLARLGGDEFAIILEHCSMEHAKRLGQQLCDQLHQFRFVHDQQSFRMGASIGLVSIDRRWATAAAIMQAADTSCYAAKEAGRNCVHVWVDTDTGIIRRHGEAQWAMRIEQALENNQFTLYAQRIQRLGKQGSPLLAEVLLRMRDDNGDVINPGAFLPAAERFHLAARIDRWVLQACLDWLLALHEPAAIHLLFINLSGQSIGDRAFHRFAIDLFARAGASICEKICLEITETAAVMNMTDAAVFVQHVRALGVRVALDDFGAGASSFGYLKSLAVDYLKIDGQFIQRLLEDALDQAAVRCFIEVARIVGLKTIAEFVDQPKLLQKVGEMGIDYAQGYLLHRPRPLEELLRRKRPSLNDTTSNTSSEGAIP